MKFLFIDWKCFGKEDFLKALTDCGHEYSLFYHADIESRTSEELNTAFDTTMDLNKYDVVFSFNYFPIISQCCMRYGIPYIAWVYDSPLLSLYSCTVLNACNHIFVFDSEFCRQMNAAGITTIHYLPMAAAVSRLDTMVPDHSIHEKLDCDISFVGSMYNESHNLFDRLTGISDYTRGYLEALMSAQMQVYGCYFVDKALNAQVLADLRRVQPYTPLADGSETDTYIYSDYFISRKITEIERHQMIYAVQDNFDMKLYTHRQPSDMKKAIYMGAVDYVKEMPYVFKCSRINLNITLRSIKSGIPLRAMDIMGAGGFLLTNYQSDFDGLFEAGTDYVYYTDKNDLIAKAAYYLEHDEERLAIAANGHNKVLYYHTFEKRIEQMLQSVFN